MALTHAGVSATTADPRLLAGRLGLVVGSGILVESFYGFGLKVNHYPNLESASEILAHQIAGECGN